MLTQRIARLEAELQAERWKSAKHDKAFQSAQKRFEARSALAAELGCENSELKERLGEAEKALMAYRGKLQAELSHDGTDFVADAYFTAKESQ